MINKPGDITKFDNSQVATLSGMFNSLFDSAPNMKYTNVLPTVSTVGERDIVVYDDGAGTKRIYVITQKGNLGYINLI